jgi:hypothetical protein
MRTAPSMPPFEALSPTGVTTGVAPSERLHTGDCAVDRLGKVGALVRKAPRSHGSGVAIAHHQERGQVLLVVSSNEGVVECHLRHLTRHTLLTAMWGGVLATLDARIAPRPEW